MLIVEYARLPEHFRDGYIVSIGKTRQLVIIEESLSDEEKNVIVSKVIRILRSYKREREILWKL